MQVTNITIRLVDDNHTSKHTKLLAYCRLVFDNSLVLHDLKIVSSHQGPFISMPSRRLTDRCPECSSSNPLHVRYCGYCGLRLEDNRILYDNEGKPKLSPQGKPLWYEDIVHPASTRFREYLQHVVLEAYEEELKRETLPYEHSS